jgi:amphi-Trp domain-containing protein
MDLIEHESEEALTREEAAKRLRQLADQLERHNQVEFQQGGIRHTVKVPKQVTFSLEIEVGDESGEIEVELRW